MRHAALIRHNLRTWSHPKSHTGVASQQWSKLRRLFDEYRCHSVYLYVGSNVGAQIQKLYEPHLYTRKDPGMISLARRLRIYDEPTAAQRAAGIAAGQAFWNSTAPVLDVPG